MKPLCFFNIKKTLLFFVLVGTAFILFQSPVFAQQTENDPAKQYNVAFPIGELGNCTNLSSCKTYCEDPTHYNECIAFAKKKGFYQEVRQEQKNTIVVNAKQELGCDSDSSCRTLCEKEENFEKCNSFAKKHNIGGGQIEDPNKKQIIEKAKQILGCDSPSSCKTFCEGEENRDKCSQLARETGLRGGETRVGPGGCTSEETCRKLCSDPQNFQICSGYSSSNTGRTFVGPGGCTSEESCQAYCEKNPKDCGIREKDKERDIRISPPAGYNPEEMCRKTPSCKWENNRCECGFYNGQERGKDNKDEFDKFCKENPDKCPNIERFKKESEKKQDDFDAFCRENPDKCKQGEQFKNESQEKRQEFERRMPLELNRNLQLQQQQPSQPSFSPQQQQQMREQQREFQQLPLQNIQPQQPSQNIQPYQPNQQQIIQTEQRLQEQREQRLPEFKPSQERREEYKSSEEFKQMEERQQGQRLPEQHPQEQRPPEMRIESQPLPGVQGASTQKSLLEKTIDYFLVR